MHPAVGRQQPAASHPVEQRPHAARHLGEPHAAPSRRTPADPAWPPFMAAGMREAPARPTVDQQASSSGHPRQPHPFVGAPTRPVRPEHPRLSPDGLAVPTKGLLPGSQEAQHGQGQPTDVSYMSAQSLQGANGQPAQGTDRFAGLCEAPSSLEFLEHFKPPSMRMLKQRGDINIVRASPHQAVNQLINIHDTASLAGQPAEQSEREAGTLRADGIFNRSLVEDHRQMTDQPANKMMGCKRKQEGQERDEPSISRRMKGSSLPESHADRGAEKQSQASKRSRSVDERSSSNQGVNKGGRQSPSQERGISTDQSDGGHHDRIKSQSPSHEKRAHAGQSPPAGARMQSAAQVRKASADPSCQDRIRQHRASQDKRTARYISPQGRTEKPDLSLSNEAGREHGRDKRRSPPHERRVTRDSSLGRSSRKPDLLEAVRKRHRERLRSRSLEKDPGTIRTSHDIRSHQRSFQDNRCDVEHTLDHRQRKRTNSQEQRFSRDGNLGNGEPASWSREARARPPTTARTMGWSPGDTFDHTPGETSCIPALVGLGALGHLVPDGMQVQRHKGRQPTNVSKEVGCKANPSFLTSPACCKRQCKVDFTGRSSCDGLAWFPWEWQTAPSG